MNTPEDLDPNVWDEVMLRYRAFSGRHRAHRAHRAHRDHHSAGYRCACGIVEDESIRYAPLDPWPIHEEAARKVKGRPIRREE